MIGAKGYIIHRSSCTFGQTAAGCHSAAGAETIVREVSASSSREDMEAFMRGLIVVISLEDRQGTIELPLPLNYNGFNAARRIWLARKAVTEAKGYPPSSMPWISCSSGDLSVYFGTTPPKLEGSTVQMDVDNLKYQRGLLA